ncbi:excinuclease ABC subunit C, partial [Candidatus Bathyarchaeota archaeon]
MISIAVPSQFNDSEIPVEPGVYLFKDDTDTVLYVGKAKNLRSRISSYFSPSNHSHKTQHLIPQIRGIDWIVVYNEVEALLLENKLVKQYMPKYNMTLKDAKS